MNKNNLINLALKELKEMEVLVNGLTDLNQIPAVMFHLADAKLNNIKGLLSQLAESNEAPVKETPASTSGEAITQPVTEAPVVQQQMPETITTPAEPEPVTEAPIVVVVEKSEPEQQLVITETVVETQVEQETKISEKPVEKKMVKTIIGETIIEKKSSVNEMLSEKAVHTLDKTLGNKKITDLKKSINLNDKFRFQRELFSGDAASLNSTLDQLNKLDDKEEAFELLSSFNWDHTDPNVSDFIDLVNRKFL